MMTFYVRFGLPGLWVIMGVYHKTLLGGMRSSV